MSSTIGCDTAGLTRDGNTTTAVLRGTGMAKREFRVLIHEHRRRHHVLGNAIGVVLGENPQILANERIEILRRHVRGESGFVEVLLGPLLAEVLPLRLVGLLLPILAASTDMAALLSLALSPVLPVGAPLVSATLRGVTVAPISEISTLPVVPAFAIVPVASAIFPVLTTRFVRGRAPGARVTPLVATSVPPRFLPSTLPILPARLALTLVASIAVGCV